MSKRKRFVITTIILSLGFVAIQLFDESYRFISIGSLSFLTLVLFTWSLKEGLGKNLTLLSLILPTFFTLGVGLFWFLLPSNIFARIPILLFYAVGIYALCLTSNIYTVAAIRTIALLRAAKGVGFVLTLVVIFLLYDTILSFRLPIYLVAPLISIISFPLFLQGLWVIKMEDKLSGELLLSTIIFSLVMGEVALGLFFWPVTVVVGSICLTVSAYILLGLGQAKHEGRLFSQTIREYLVVGLLVFIGLFLATRWAS